MRFLTRNIFFRYLFSGGMGFITQIGALFILHDYFHVWYLLASTIGAICAVIVGFLFQKFWTFQKRGGNVRREVFIYVCIFCCNLVLNALFMYVFVDLFDLWHMFAQFLTSGLIAFGSFFLYKYVVFKEELKDLPLA